MYWIAAPGTVDGLTQADRWSKYYEQTVDIDASATGQGGDWGSAGWTPIGDTATAFTGTYDGQGKKITGLYINQNNDNLGLFGVIRGANVHDLGLTGVSINANNNSFAGGIAGQCQDGSTVQNCYSSGSFSGNSNIGGLVGRNFNPSGPGSLIVTHLDQLPAAVLEVPSLAD